MAEDNLGRFMADNRGPWPPVFVERYRANISERPDKLITGGHGPRSSLSGPFSAPALRRGAITGGHGPRSSLSGTRSKSLAEDDP